MNNLAVGLPNTPFNPKNPPFHAPAYTPAPLGSAQILSLILYKAIPLVVLVVGLGLVVKGKRTAGVILIILGLVFFVRFYLAYFLFRNLF